jgi:ribonucleotide reductase beta subunit family protein with ferritin-like domain
VPTTARGYPRTGASPGPSVREEAERLTDSNEEEVHAKIRRAYEDAMKMDEEERAKKQTISSIELGLVFFSGFVSAMLLAAYNC